VLRVVVDLAVVQVMPPSHESGRRFSEIPLLHRRGHRGAPDVCAAFAEGERKPVLVLAAVVLVGVGETGGLELEGCAAAISTGLKSMTAKSPKGMSQIALIFVIDLLIVPDPCRHSLARKAGERSQYLVVQTKTPLQPGVFACFTHFLF